MDNTGGQVQASDFIPQYDTKSAYNPFHIKLLEKESSIQDGIKFTLDAQESGFLIACWGASISDIYPVIYMQWEKLKNSFLNPRRATELLKQKSISINCRSLECCDSEEIYMKPESTPDLGKVPRDKYPLVLFIVSQSLSMNVTTSNVSEENYVVFHALVIHLKDEECPLESHIVSHFVRCIGGSPCDLKQLYTSGLTNNEGRPTDDRTGSENSNIQSDIPTSDTNRAVDICVVCQIKAVNKVFLPCRHTCVCNNCFVKIDKCPMCRGVIYSCFSLNEEHIEDNTEENDDDMNEHWLYRLNNRLNTFFGFT